MRVYALASELDFGIADLPRFPLPDAVLLVRPSFFEVAYVINPHMEGRIGSVDRQAALGQWERVVDTYRMLSLDVHLMEGRPGLPDMVFCANQTLPAIDRQQGRTVVLSSMLAPERQPEVSHFEHFFTEQGYGIHRPPLAAFEGMGDALWHYDRQLLWLGTGYRSAVSVADSVSRALGVKTVRLRLIDPLFYHLDTCLSILDAETALWVPSAFDEAGQEIIGRLIPTLVEVPLEEAATSLACNAHCPDGHNVLIQSGCDETAGLIRDRGFNVIECETGEFLKSGGSVFCMKQMFWTEATANRYRS